jgi:hypothetical protein
MPVFQRIQRAGKKLHIRIAPDEIDAFLCALRPEGVMLCMQAHSADEADALIERASRWKAH